MKADLTERAKILIVDDRTENLLALETLLSLPELEIFQATSGTKALELCLKHDFALILLDASMPEMDGYETASLLRVYKKTKNVPIIFLTALYTDMIDIKKGYDAGAVDYMSKPIEPDILISKVMVFRELYLQRRQLEHLSDMLFQSEQKYVRFIETIGDAVFFTDAQTGIIEEANKKAEELLGMAMEEIIGTPQKSLHPPQEEQEFKELFEKDIQVGRAINADLHVTGKDNDLVPVNVRACLCDYAGKSIIASIYRDIGDKIRCEKELKAHYNHLKEVVESQTSNLKAANEQLVQEIAVRTKYEEKLKIQAELLERSNKELESFAYTASHDLQEPLRKVASYTQLLAKRYKGRLDEKADTFIEYILDGAQRMKRMIDDLLTFSRIEHQQLKLVSVDCGRIVENVLSTLSYKIELNKTVVTVGPMPTVMAYETHLFQLFQNLISNAVKFKGLSPPEIHIEATPITVKRSESSPLPQKGWLFSVRDNGIGIPYEERHRVFDMFQRLHGRGEYEGSGLGLAICKKIVEHLGGQIWVESEEGKEGTAFFFEIPEGRDSLLCDD